ncbi:MAG: FHA domain-containing protein, partial [Immundisolibacteraceae bacterium]|nr:FHA domain-containing protein [Immundisolibacteraceae bacterium]
MLELRFKNRSYSAVIIDRPRITIGSDPGNDVVLPESGVAEFQMELFRQDGQVLAVDLTGSGCKKNGQPIQGSDAIVGGDVINLESIEIEVVDPLLATEKFDVSDMLAADQIPDPDLVSALSPGVDGNEMAAVLAAANDSSSAWSLKGLNESVVGLRFPLGGKIVIGRDPSCDLVLDLPQISRRHTEIEVLNSQLFLRDLGSTNGSSVNGHTVSSATVRPGDRVSIDVVEFVVEGPEDEQENTIARSFAIAADAPVGPYLLIRSGDRAGEKILLVNNRYSIGRTPGNDIVLEDQSISKRHALIVRTNGGWKIEDCESTNGTSINGETVMGGQLHHADRVRIGGIKIAFIVP